MNADVTPQQWQRIQTLFHEASELPAAEQHEFVRTRAADDMLVCREVMGLLGTQQAGAPSLEPPDAEALQSWLDPHAEDALVGLDLGDCTLRESIGRGGMGVVYEAWQEPPGRQVAVKLLGDALGSPEARYRFQHEARVLGSLRHPTIAQVYRVGTHRATTELPYFVMEYVPEAAPISEYVRREKLDLRAILGLVVEVCRGVHAGHVRGVIHRDLKPANILVGGDARPKIIDFGIARLAAGEDDDASPRTRTGQLMGTVTYMSPEQLGGRDEAIDTRSDVYALGVILYELLTGKLPYDFEELGLVEIIGAVRNRPPTPPERYRPDLPRDLGVIMRKALAKEPDARYGSAQALAEDLERFLDSRPIFARPPSLAYQLRLYARRHRVAFASMFGGILVLVASLVVISLFAASEARARRRAERQETLARKLLHESAGFIPEITDHLDNKLGALFGATRVRRLLAEKVEGLAQRLAALEGVSEDPVVLRALAAAEVSVGRIKGDAGGPNLGEGGAAEKYYRRAVGHLEQAVAVRPGDDDLLHALVDARVTLATKLQAGGRIDEARAILAEVEPKLERLEGHRPEDLFVRLTRVDFLRTRAAADWYENKRDAALAGYRKVLAIAQGLDLTRFGERKRDMLLLQGHLDLATSCEALGKTEEARRETEEVVRLAEKVRRGEPGRNRLWLLWHVHDKLGDLATARRAYKQALERHEEGLAIAQELAAADPHDAEARTLIQSSEGSLGVVCEHLQRFEDAERHMRACLTALRAIRKAQPEHRVLEWDERIALTRLGAVQYQLRAFDEARAHLREAMVLQAKRLAREPASVTERTGMAEVESTFGFLCATEAGEQVDAHGAMEGYRASLAWFEKAVAHTRKAKEDGPLPPGFEHNLGLWQNMVDLLRSNIDKLEKLPK